MSVILCYGDSNTWGYDPVTKDRLPRDTRWTGVMRQELGEGFWVIEEGLNGRTTVWDDPIEGHKNGKEQLIPCLETHCPFDLIIIMLGTNDLKLRFSVPAYDIANGAGVLIDIVQKSAAGPDGGPPKVLLVAPPRIAKLTDFADMFAGAEEKSLKFPENFKRVAEEYDCHFLDAATVIVSSNLDGIHYEASEHDKLGRVMADMVRQILA